MRRSGIGFAILALLVAIGVGVGAYNIGYHHGLDVNGSVEVVRYAGWHAGGFFPFGLFLFPLLFFAVFALLRGAFWRRGWSHDDHHGPWGHGPGGPMGTGGRDAFEDWHRRQHEPEAHEAGREGGEQAAT